MTSLTMTSRLLTLCIASSLLPVATAPQPNVRLVDGADEHSGRLEVQIDGAWGTVCDDLFDMTEVRVVCNELGYNDMTQGSEWTMTGPTSIYLMDNVMCTGGEESIIECPYDPTDDCGASETVGMSCAVAGSDGCLQNPPCAKLASECPYGETEVVTVEHSRCPICRCASCPSKPPCPLGCKSKKTEYYQDTNCRRCRCVAQDLPDVIEEPSSISTSMLVAVCAVALGVPIVVLVVVIIVKRSSGRPAKPQKVRPRDAAMVAPQQNNWFGGGGGGAPGITLSIVQN